MGERGRIVPEGMGGFLNPPGHPEHEWSVRVGFGRDAGCMCLRSAVESEWLDAATRDAARAKLAAWVPLPMGSPEVVDWCRNVLGYFRSMYGDPRVPEPERWNVDKLCVVNRESGDAAEIPVLDTDEDHSTIFFEHAGVHFIRKFYPEYVGLVEDFANAYWGKKPEEVAV
jgi:hypothetical protein